MFWVNHGILSQDLLLQWSHSIFLGCTAVVDGPFVGYMQTRSAPYGQLDLHGVLGATECASSVAELATSFGSKLLLLNYGQGCMVDLGAQPLQHQPWYPESCFCFLSGACCGCSSWQRGTGSDSQQGHSCMVPFRIVTFVVVAVVVSAPKSSSQ